MAEDVAAVVTAAVAADTAAETDAVAAAGTDPDISFKT
jgi:hypothetical protein